MTNDPALPGFGTVRDGWGGVDTIRVIENVRGSGHADVINMDDRANVVWGYGGDDAINGAGGADDLDGGAGNDVLSGGAGDGTDTVTDFNLAEGDAIVRIFVRRPQPPAPPAPDPGVSASSSD